VPESWVGAEGVGADDEVHAGGEGRGQDRFLRPDLARRDGKLQPIWNCPKSSKKGGALAFVPFFSTPQGAVPKKLADGAIDPDNCRPTSDFSRGLLLRIRWPSM
jgi:hypothetical protein